MNKPLEETLKEATKDLLSDESLKAINEAFQTRVDEAVKASEAKLDERITLAINEALEKQDTDYTGKLEKLLEAIDNDHTVKLEKIVARIDENHSAKLVILAEKYNKEAKTEAENFKRGLVEKVSKFLDLRLLEVIPTAKISEAVNNTRAKKIIKNIQQAVSLDEAFVNNEIRGALVDGKKQIDESNKAVTQLQDQVKVLTEQGQKLRTSLLLEQKTINLPKEKKDYVLKVLGTKDAKFINENYSYVVEMFEKNEVEEVEQLKETAQGVTKREKIDQPVIIEEEVTHDESMSVYLEGLKED